MASMTGAITQLRAFGAFTGQRYSAYDGQKTIYNNQTKAAQAVFSGSIKAQAFDNTIKAQVISSGAIVVQN